jgi:hypothetical protein
VAGTVAVITILLPLFAGPPRAAAARGQSGRAQGMQE